MNYFVGEFAKSGSLLYIGGLQQSDPKLQPYRDRGLMAATLNFPIPILTLALMEATDSILSGLLYAEPPTIVVERGPEHIEPLGMVDFHLESREVQTFVLREKPMRKALVDGRRKLWRERILQERRETVPQLKAAR